VGETFDPVGDAGSKASPRPARPEDKDQAVSLTAALVTFGIIFLAELPDKTLVASLVLGSRFRPLHVWVGVAAAFLVHVTLAVAVGSVFTLLPHRVVDAVALALFVIGAVLVYREGAEKEPDELDEARETERETAEAVGSGRPGGPGTTLDAAATPAGASGETVPAEPGTGVSSTNALPAAGRKARETPRGFWRVAATSFTVIFVAEMGDLTQISTANLAARFGSPVSVWLGAVLALWAVAALAIAGGRGLLRVVPVKVITRIAAVAFVVLAVISLIDVIRG
jgi:putative Ca2+/H+ antiporter (TMEM165/GDT1 family)